MTSTTGHQVSPASDDEWPLGGDPDSHVGKRHHLLPKFYLERFARGDRIAVIDPRTHARRVTPIRDTATERDFYTFVNTEGQLDGRLEQLLSQIEGDAARAIRNLTSMFGTHIGPQDRVSVCLLLAFQMNRGRASRRRVEQLGDLSVRVLLDRIRDEDSARAFIESRGGVATEESVAELIDMCDRLDEFEFTPDPNDHIGMIGELAREAMPYLLDRPWYLFEFPAPSLVTSDEPVGLYTPGQHDDDEALGLANAQKVYFPLDSFRLLALGASGSDAPSVTRLPGTADTAEFSNWLTSYNAYESVFIHPDVDITLPQATDHPLFRVTTEASDALERYNEAPRSRRTQRRRAAPRPPG